MATTHHIKKFLSRKRVHLSILALVFLCASVVLIIVAQKKQPTVPIVAADESVLSARDPLTGVPVEVAVPYKQIFAVMIDGHVDAQPVSGIDQAFLVIEAPVEAGIPRMLAFFSEDQQVEKIGPVRSARPYFIDWANELDALYVHVGGSDAALEKIATGITFDLNQFWHDAQFLRDARRFAPHNVYTSTELLRTYVQTKKEAGRVSQPLYAVWKFGEEVEGFEKELGERGEEGKKIEVSYGSPEYDVVWEYDAQKEKYVRWQNGKPVATSEGAPVVVENVVLMETDIAILDAVGRRKVRTMGTGEATVFRDGTRIPAQWKKESVSDRLLFFDEEGKEIEMKPGKTWIEVNSKF
jgi:hypothetical protein